MGVGYMLFVLPLLWYFTSHKINFCFQEMDMSDSEVVVLHIERKAMTICFLLSHVDPMIAAQRGPAYPASPEV